MAQYGQVAPQNNLQQLVGDVSMQLRSALHLPSLPPTLMDPSLALANDPESLHHLAEGLRLFRAGEAVAARPELEAAVARSPHAPLALAALARDDRTLSLDVEAGKNARLALAAMGGLPPEQKLLVEAQSYDALHDYAKSAACAEQLHTLAPQNIDYIYYLAFEYVLGNKPEKTLATLKLLPASAVSPQPRANSPLYQAFAAQDQADYRTQLLRAGEAIKLAQAQGRRGVEFRALLLEGTAWQRLGDLPHAMADNRRAEQVAHDRGDWQGVTAALLQQGNVLSELGDPQALPTVQRAITLAEKGGDRRDEAALLITLGNVYVGQVDFLNAIVAYRKAVTLNQEVNNPGNLAAALGNLPMVELGTAPDDALRDAKAALTLAESLKNSDRQAQSLEGVGLSEKHLGQTSEAREHLTQALGLASSVGRTRAAANITDGLAQLEMRCGHLEQARRLMSQVDAAHALPERDADVHATVEASLTLEEGNAASAQRSLESLLRTTHDPFVASQAGAVLADSLLRQDKIAAARGVIDKAVAETQKLPGDPDDNAQVLLVEARVAIAEGKLVSASATLAKLRADAERWKDAWLLAEVGFAQATLDRQEGNIRLARVELRAAQDRAKRQGYGLIVTKSDMQLEALASST